MFVQVIQGRVTDPISLRTSLDHWVDELSPRAQGWLGFTGGVTDDGMFIGLARFVSQEDARRNSGRPEQQQWWAVTSKLFEGDVTFLDCPEVEIFLNGGSDDAGFVQIMQGDVSDVEQMRALDKKMAQPLSTFRPEIIGGVTGLPGDGTFTAATYFTSEEAAREGEQRPAPAELEKLFAGGQALMSNVRFYDLHQPWLMSPTPTL